MQTWSAAFFFVPVVRVLLLLDRQELRADRAAVRACGVAPVAGALFTATGVPDHAAVTALAAMGGPALLEACSCSRCAWPPSPVAADYDLSAVPTGEGL